DRGNFAIQPLTPGLKACAHADVVVGTGSHGTAMQALWHGKPVVAIPYNIDQATIAARLVELGIGFNLNPVGLRDFSDRQRYFDKAVAVPWSAVLDDAARALDDAALRDRAHAFRTALRAAGEPAIRAAELVERHAERTRAA